MSTEDSLASLEAWRRSETITPTSSLTRRAGGYPGAVETKKEARGGDEGRGRFARGEGGGGGRGTRRGIGLGPRGYRENRGGGGGLKVSVEEAEEAMLRAEAESDAAAEDAARAGSRAPPVAERSPPERSSPSKRREDAPRWRLRARSLGAAATKPRRAPQREGPAFARVRRRGGPRLGRP